MFLYTEVEAASNVAYGHPLFLKHTFAIHAEFLLDISPLPNPPPLHVLDGFPEVMRAPSAPGR